MIWRIKRNMANAFIHGYFSTDLEDFDSSHFEDLSDVYFPLDIYIGPQKNKDTPSDIFQVLIATPEGIRKNLDCFHTTGIQTLIVSSYDWAQIQVVIEKIVAQCTGSTWESVAQLLCRYFRWEFEDYELSD